MQNSANITEYVTLAAGLRTHCAEAGEGDLVVLIHGSLCDYRYWRWQMDAFSQHFRVLVPSLPGCWPEAVGGSSAAEAGTQARREAALADTRYGMVQHVRAITDICAQTAPETSIHLVGHSRGAQVALETALAIPGRISSLVLADPGFPFSDEGSTQPVHQTIADKLGSAPLDDVLSEFVDAVNGAGSWRSTVSWFKEMVRANAWTLLAQAQDIDRSIEPQAVATVDGPVLLVGGQMSPARYGTRIQRLAELLPQARQVVVPRAAHGMNLANARFFNETVLEFLQQPQHR